MPELSPHFRDRRPSPIRHAQILFRNRADAAGVRCVNLAIGNVSLPMHPAMIERLRTLGEPGSPFASGAVQYTHTAGTDEAQQAFLHVIQSGGFDASELQCLVTDGGSQAMEIMILGTCGPGSDRPLMVLEPAYANYTDLSRRACVPVVSVRRDLQPDGSFTVQDLSVLDAAMARERPAALVIIPADNPTGSFLRQEAIDEIAALTVKHDAWLVSDEAYRQLQYHGESASSIWALSEETVPDIQGRRVSIETSSKVWNACGLRIGGLVTDNPEFHAKSVAEYTANLCANAIGQHVFGALASISPSELQDWYRQQREYYQAMMQRTVDGLRRELPGILVSNPEAALYSVLDVRKIVPESFDAVDFVSHCAERGNVDVDGQPHTLLLAPMGGFYDPSKEGADRPSRTQMRLAYVEPPKEMEKVPRLLAALVADFRERLDA